MAAGAFFAVVRVAGAFFTALLVPGAFLATAFLAGAFFATAFLAGAFLAAAFVAGAFFAAVVAFFAATAVAVGFRVGVAVVAEVAFFRATRAVVGVGFPPGVLAAVAPVARLVAVATFFAAALFGIGALRAPVAFLALLGLVAAWAIVPPRGPPRPDGCVRRRRAGRPARRACLPGAPVVKPGGGTPPAGVCGPVVQ
ncbi:hypothetical protein Nm8I071_30950 [Nonomuraea sp. TT08I-71]|nr:hypothetical protein Nm8I071_30950 [Nonomuraea sp. TT08I-71]